MATHNIEDGTGGMDGSLVYELDRPEVRTMLRLRFHGKLTPSTQNAGIGFNLSSSDFELFPNKYVSSGYSTHCEVDTH